MGVKMSLLEKVMVSKPINKTASLVVGKGERYDYKTTHSIYESEFMPPCIANLKDLSKKKMNMQRVESFIKLMGVKKGRLTVVGLIKPAKSNKINGCRFVVRCDCGMYTIRRSKSLNNKKNVDDCCGRCQRLKDRNRHSEYLAYGRNL